MTVTVTLLLGALIGLSLGALGGGGSILTVPALVYALGESAQSATTASLVIVGITSVVAAVGHARSGNVRWRTGIVFGLAGAATSYLGSVLNRAVDPNALLLAFAGLMLVAAAAMLRRSTKDRDQPTTLTAAGPEPRSPFGGPVAILERPAAPTAQPAQTRQVGKLVTAAAVVGFLTGFLGVGGGFIVVPALVVALEMPMAVAVGTSLLVIAFNSGIALAARSGADTFDWAVIVPFTIAAISGSLAGKQIADRVSGPVLTKAFATLLVMVAIYVAVRSGIALI